MAQPDRLERMITRLTTQRSFLSHGLALVADLPGPILEFGLGKGRTYDYLRRHAAGRRVIAFDREIHCPPDVVPPPEDLILGDFHDTVPGALERIGGKAALVHFDIGSSDPAADASLAAWLSVAAEPLIADGGVIITDRELSNPRWRQLANPPGRTSGYHTLYLVEAAAG